MTLGRYAWTSIDIAPPTEDGRAPEPWAEVELGFVRNPSHNRTVNAVGGRLPDALVECLRSIVAAHDEARR